MMFIAFGVIVVDISNRKKKLDTITAIYFGLISWSVYDLRPGLGSIAHIWQYPGDRRKNLTIQDPIRYLGIVVCYCASVC